MFTDTKAFSGFERYEGFDQEDQGVMRGHGPDFAWFVPI